MPVLVISHKISLLNPVVSQKMQWKSFKSNSEVTGKFVWESFSLSFKPQLPSLLLGSHCLVDIQINKKVEYEFILQSEKSYFPSLTFMWKRRNNGLGFVTVSKLWGGGKCMWGGTRVGYLETGIDWTIKSVTWQRDSLLLFCTSDISIGYRE